MQQHTSRLAKNEIEDLYYRTAEDNLELKRTINEQKKKLKLLSTRFIRLNNCIKHSGTRKAGSLCCIKAEDVITLQKNEIQDLELSNRKLHETIRQLKYGLSTKKQYTLRPVKSYTSVKSNNFKSNISFNEKNNIDRVDASTDCNSLRKYYIDVSIDVQKDLEYIDNSKMIKELNVNRGIQTDIVDKRDNYSYYDNDVVVTKHDDEIQSKLMKQLDELLTEKSSTLMDNKIITKELLQTKDRCCQLELQLNQAIKSRDDVEMELTEVKCKLKELHIQLKSSQMNNEVISTIEEQILQSEREFKQHIEIESVPSYETNQVNNDTINKIQFKHFIAENQSLTSTVASLQAQIDLVNTKLKNSEVKTPVLEKSHIKEVLMCDEEIQIPSRIHSDIDDSSKIDKSNSLKEILNKSNQNTYTVSKEICMDMNYLYSSLKKKTSSIPIECETNVFKKRSSDQVIFVKGRKYSVESNHTGKDVPSLSEDVKPDSIEDDFSDSRISSSISITSNYSSTYSDTSEIVTLSEGELPIYNHKQCYSKRNSSDKSYKMPNISNVPQSIETKINAISSEITKCKEFLDTHHFTINYA